ncbi:hypothetical protein DPMN_145831 [Dreissena polymorpha]|uniref:Uncharacterized protein n=1 Tax=Dreissena polymorpha TaxID=45954 RepID=A0A9D4J1R6_DREPO|nr:hypothetical protein DPMN_145831 [Dreissena polymorpha]
MNGQVRLLPNTLHKLKKLKSLTLYGTSKATDIQKWFAFTNKDHSEINHSPLPLTITNITFIDVWFSTLSLRRLLRTISKLNHQATCYLNQCCITTSEQISEGLISSPDSLMIPCDMSNVSLTIEGENPDLYDALIGSDLVCINIIQINHPSSLSEALLTLTRLKTLRLISREYIDIPIRLIRSEMKLVFIYKTLSVDSLRHLLRRTSVLNYSVESQILFGYTEQLDGFMAIKQELLATKQIDVKEFATMGRSSYCLNSMHETVEMDFFRNLHYVSDHMINVQLRYNCSQKLQPRCSVN